jgi:hypothetical protein
MAVGSFAVWTAVRYANQPLLEFEAWRQTMTAIPSYWMLREGWSLAYQNPVLGYPWSIPLEFPLFESIVAFIVWIGHFPLDPVGRLLSFTFLLACAWPAFQIVRRVGLPSDVAWGFCALLWSSPLYLFFGRSFLMETAALFFTFAAVPYALDLRDPTWKSALLFALFSTLGMLQKASTPLAMVIIMAVWLFVLHFRRNGLAVPPTRHLVRVLVAFLIPTIATILWFEYTDGVKSRNALIYATHSSAGMAQGWLGGYRLLIDLGAEKLVFWDRIIRENASGFLGVAVLTAGLFGGTSCVKSTIAMSLVLFAAPIWLIMNQHYFLPYYQIASVLFLLAAIAVAVVMGMRWFPGRSNAIPFLISISLVAGNYYHYGRGYGRYVSKHLDTSNSRTLAVSDVIRRYTPAESGIAVFGLPSTDGLRPVLGWSAEIAYYSERKSITLGRYTAGDVVWDDPASRLGGKALGAMVFCYRDEMSIEQYNRLIAKYAQNDRPALFPIQDCDVWLPGVDSIDLAHGVRVWPRRSL